jgi:2-oxoglutarate ferredoxin oxidoreductase subunit alpha
MHATEGKIIIDGNSAAALGAMFAGVTVVTWYPITPSSSVVESLIDYMKKYRVEEDGKASFAIVQAEDELAAIGMVLGAGWAGARSMTSTSGPGISLMAEFAGLGYFAELPGVIFDIQRVGPSTGMPTRTMQGDLLSIAYLSHGDTKHVMLLPASVNECYKFAMEAFDLAEQLQTPVFVLSDLDMGMNNWMSEPFVYPEKPLNRGKVLSREDLERLGGFERYKDVDGDAIPYRTLPGTDHPKAAYFTRGSGHNEKALYTERPDDYQNLMERLDRKFETARTLVPAPEVVQTGKSKIGLIAFGSSDFAVRESRDQLKKEYGLETDYLRLRAFPFPPKCMLLWPPRQGLRDRAEPRWANAQLAEAGPSCCRDHQAEKCSPLRRLAPRRAHRDRQAGPSGGDLMATTLNPPVAPGPKKNRLGCRFGLPRRQDDPLRRMRAQRHLRAHCRCHV